MDGHGVLEHHAEALDSFFDHFGAGIGEIDAEGVVTPAAGEEALTGYKGNFMFERLLENFGGIERFGQRDHEEEAAFGTSPCGFGGEVFVHEAEHEVAPFTVDLPEHGDVRGEEGFVLRDFVGDELVEGAGVEVGGLFDLHQFFDDGRGGDEVADAQAGGENFGEGSGVDDVTIDGVGTTGGGFDFEDGGDFFAAVAQFTVGIIFDKGELMLDEQLREFEAAFVAEGDALRVLEGGDGIDDFVTLGEQRLEFVYDHAVGIGGNGGELNVVGTPRGHHAEIGGVFDNDMIAMIDEDTPQHIDALLRTAGDEDVIGMDSEVGGGEAAGDEAAKFWHAFTGAVLKNFTAAFGKDDIGGMTDAFHRKEFRRRQPTGKRNDIRLCRELEDFTDGRTLHEQSGVRKHLIPIHTVQLSRRSD